MVKRLRIAALLSGILLSNQAAQAQFLGNVGLQNYTTTLTTTGDATAASTDYFVPVGNSGGSVIILANGVGVITGGVVSVTIGPDTTATHQWPILSCRLLVSSINFCLVPSAQAQVATITYTKPAAGSAGTYSLYFMYGATTTAPTPMKLDNLSTSYIPDVGCTRLAPTGDITGPGTFRIIQASTANTRVRLCHLSMSFAGATDFQIVTGTGTNCGTDTTVLSSTYKNIVSLALDFEAPGAGYPAYGTDYCIVLGSAVVGGGMLSVLNSRY